MVFVLCYFCLLEQREKPCETEEEYVYTAKLEVC